MAIPGQADGAGAALGAAGRRELGRVRRLRGARLRRLRDGRQPVT